MLDLKSFRDKKIGVAVSGGGDSVALLHYLRAQKSKCGYSLFAIHCEHGIRGEESLADMRFVQSLCADWEIPLFLLREDCPARAKGEKQSLETAARNFRYESFSSLLKGGELDFVATAHHLGDEAETVLFRMARGSALTGAGGMKERNGGYIRPFLDISKEEIVAYLQENGLPFRQDSTNFQTDATRNKIRLEVLPKLEEAVGGAIKNVARFARLAREDDELLYALSDELLVYEKGKITVRFSEKKPLFTRACLTAMKGLGLEKDYTEAHLSALFDLQASERGSFLTLPKLHARKTRTGILFYLPSEEKMPPLALEKDFDLSGYDGGRYEVNVKKAPSKEETEWRELRLDVEKIPKTAVFRFRREGDFMEVFGGGTKSLKKLFNEKKIPPKERKYLPLIAEKENGRVYAVCGVEISERVKVEEGATSVVYISVRKKEK